MQQVEAMTLPENDKHFASGAVKLIKEMKENDYKVTVSGAELFIDSCADTIGIEAANFYRLCVVKNLELFR